MAEPISPVIRRRFAEEIVFAGGMRPMRDRSGSRQLLDLDLLEFHDRTWVTQLEGHVTTSERAFRLGALRGRLAVDLDRDPGLVRGDLEGKPFSRLDRGRL